MNRKTKQVLTQKIKESMLNDGLTWDYSNKGFEKYPVSPRTLHSICDNYTFNISNKTIIKLCKYFGIEYQLDGTEIALCEQK